MYHNLFVILNSLRRLMIFVKKSVLDSLKLLWSPVNTGTGKIDGQSPSSIRTRIKTLQVWGSRTWLRYVRAHHPLEQGLRPLKCDLSNNYAVSGLIIHYNKDLLLPALGNRVGERLLLFFAVHWLRFPPVIVLYHNASPWLKRLPLRRTAPITSNQVHPNLILSTSYQHPNLLWKIFFIFFVFSLCISQKSVIFAFG